MKRGSRIYYGWGVMILISLILVRLYLSLFQNALIDDAFITFQYARNLRDHLTWGFFPGVTTNTATSPLNVVLTALMGVIIKDMVRAAIWLATIESLVMMGFLLAISRRVFNAYDPGVVSFLGVMLNPLLVSTLGLETLLYFLLVVAGLYGYLSKKTGLLAVSLALLTLTRADGVLLFLVMVYALARWEKIGWRQLTRFVTFFFLCILPWFIFSWIYLGSFVPDTFFLKVNQNWWGFDYLSGIGLYLYRYPLPMLSSFVFAPFGFLCALGRKRHAPPILKILLIFGTFYYVAYAILRVPPYHWYYAPVAICLNLAGSLGLAAALAGSGERGIFQRSAIAVLVAALVGLGVLTPFVQAQAYPLPEPPIHSNWAAGEQYREIGLWIKGNISPESRFRLEGEIGTLAFYSQRRLLDMFSCRYELQSKIDRLFSSGGLLGFFTRFNFYWFEPGEPCEPYDYRLSFVSKEGVPLDIDEGFVRSWETGSKWIAEGRIVLWKIQSQ